MRKLSSIWSDYRQFHTGERVLLDTQPATITSRVEANGRIELAYVTDAGHYGTLTWKPQVAPELPR